MPPTDSSKVSRAVRATALCLVAVAVIAGPLVPWVDLTRPQGGEHLVCDGGTATVSVVEPPGGVSLEAERFGAGTYSFVAEDAVVNVDTVKGCPRLVYRLEVPALGVDARQVVFLEGHDGGEVVLSPPPAAVPPDEVNRTAYDGTVVVELQGDANEELYRANVTVEVIE